MNERAMLYRTIAAMLGTQAVAVIVFIAVPVMAVEMAPDFGVAAKDISVFMSVVFAAAMVFSAASGSLIRRHGGIRANQIGMFFSACCLSLVLFKSLPLLFLAAILVGIGYGPNTPSGAHVLAKVTPVNARAFVFSMKQSGAPIGGLIAGMLIPLLVTQIGWQGALCCTILIAFIAIVAIQPLRDSLDDDRDPNAKLVFASPWHAIGQVLSNPPLRRLIVVAFFLTTTQAIVLTFLIIILVEELAISYTVAGVVFATAQAAGAFLRVAMGFIADKAFGARVSIAILGIGASFGLASLTYLEPSSPTPVILGLSAVLGALSFGWNGVFLAEVVNLAGPQDVGTATGGALFFLYGGIVFGPIFVSLAVTLSGGYSVPFHGVALLTAVACLNLWLRPAK